MIFSQKKVIISLLIVVLVLINFVVLAKVFPTENLKTQLVNLQSPCGFALVTDISGYKYEQEINALIKNCIVTGYPDQTFKPNLPVNRAELSKMVMSAFFGEDELNAALDFYKKQNIPYAGLIDVPIDAWYAKYVSLGILEETIRGYLGESVQLYGLQGHPFKPDNPVTYAEAFKILYATKLSVDNTNEELKNELFYAQGDRTSLGYVPFDDWSRPYMIAGVKLGLIPTDFVAIRNAPIDRGTFAFLATNMLRF